MTLTLIGSNAAKRWFNDFREPKDYDYYSTEPAEVNGDLLVDERLGQWEWREIATPEELYTIKVSHAFWEIGNSWKKHAYDILFFQDKGVQFNRELYDILLPIWKQKHRKKSVSLNKKSADFFKDAVKRKYVHDSLHESVAYFDQPLFRTILKEGQEVLVDSDKFFSMDYDLQLKMVREEIYVTALERILIPNDFRPSPRGAYAWALQRTITSLFKGEWALFTVLNLKELYRPDCDYVKRHKENQHLLQLNHV